MAAASSIEIQAIAKDLASATLKEIRENVDSLGSASGKAKGPVNSFGEGLKGVFTVAAGFIAANVLGNLKDQFTSTFTESIGAAKKFETTMTNVATLISGDSTAAIKELSNQVLNLTHTIPKSADELGAGAYQILSAGITDTAKAVNVLEASGKLSVAGLGTTTESVDILTSAINAFRLDAHDTDLVANYLFKTIKAGKTTVSDMSQGFGRIAPTAAAAGIKIEELTAATAAMTSTGLSASDSYTQMRQLFVELVKPGDALAGALNRVGITDAKATIESKGLKFVLDQLRTAAGGTSTGLLQLFGSTEAAAAAIGLTDTVSTQFTQNLHDMTDGTNKLDEAFNKQADTAENRTVVANNKAQEAMIKLGEALMPLDAGFNELRAGFFTGMALEAGKINEAVSRPGGLMDAVAGLLGISVSDADGTRKSVEKLGEEIGIKFTDMIADGITSLTKFINKINETTAAWAVLIQDALSNEDEVRQSANKDYTESQRIAKERAEEGRKLLKGNGVDTTGMSDADVVAKAMAKGFLSKDASKGVSSSTTPANYGVPGGTPYASKGANYGVPRYAEGTNYVPETGLAMIHKGEKIIPADQNGGIQIINNFPQGVTANDVVSRILFQLKRT